MSNEKESLKWKVIFNDYGRQNNIAPTYDILPDIFVRFNNTSLKYGLRTKTNTTTAPYTTPQQTIDAIIDKESHGFTASQIEAVISSYKHMLNIKYCLQNWSMAQYVQNNQSFKTRLENSMHKFKIILDREIAAKSFDNRLKSLNLQKYLNGFSQFKRTDSLDRIDIQTLTPTTELIYIQLSIDPNNELLIDGYFRNYLNVFFPSDIKHIILKYYMKQYSKKELRDVCIEKQRLKYSHEEQRSAVLHHQNQANQERKNKFKDIIIWSVIIISIICAIVIVFGSDICGFSIQSTNDCNLVTEANVIFDIKQYLLIGCVTHMLCILFAVILQWIAVKFVEAYNCFDNHFWECFPPLIVSIVELWSLSWSIVGFVIYAHTNTESISAKEKECIDMVIAWSVLKVIECVIITPIFIYFCACWFAMAAYDYE